MRFYQSQQYNPQSLFVQDTTPWDALFKVAAEQQQKHDALSNSISSLSNDFKINSSPAQQDLALREQKLKYYKDKADQLAADFMAGKSTGDIPNRLFQLKNEYSTDNDRLILEENAKTYQEKYLNDLSKVQEDSKYLQDLDPFVDYNRSGKFGRFNYTGLEGYQDPNKTRTELMSDIATHVEDVLTPFQDPTTGMIGYSKTKFETLGADKIKQIAEAQLPNYLSTIPGKQQYKLLSQRVGQDKALEVMQDELYREGLKQFKNNVTERGMSWHNLPDAKETDNPFDSEGAYYGTPNTPLQGKDLDLDEFDIQKAAGPVEIQSTGQYAVPVRKTITGGFKDFNKLSSKNQKVAMSIAKVLSPTIYRKLEKGQELDSKEKAFLYARSKKAAESLNKSKEVNSSIFPLTTKEANAINNQIFGKPDPTIENSTGNLINAKFWDKNENKEISGKQLLEKYSDDTKTPVRINGKLDAKNPYTYLTDNSDYVNGYQVSIGGDEYIMTGPNYTNPLNRALKNEKIAENAVYGIKLAGSNVPAEINLNGIPIKIEYDDKKGYIVKHKDIIHTFATPQDVVEFTKNQPIE